MNVIGFDIKTKVLVYRIIRMVTKCISFYYTSTSVVMDLGPRNMVECDIRQTVAYLIKGKLAYWYVHKRA